MFVEYATDALVSRSIHDCTPFMKKELTLLETIKAVYEVKKYFESQLEKRLELQKVPSPLFVKTSSGLQDQLSGKEEAISF